MGDITIQGGGTSHYSSAFVQGNILGIPIDSSDGMAAIGQHIDRSVQITLIHN